MTSPHNKQASHCPLAGVDRRLEDAHQHWHQAEQAYFHPESFRAAIQTTIQTLRTVTFILQNKKHNIPDFEAWYGVWQDKLKADPLMLWMVNARNKIEKQGDLEVYSFIRAEIIASYLDEGPRVEVPARLFDDPSILLQKIPRVALREHIVKHGTLRIQRRWVENTLPDYELLDAVAIAYGKIAQIVHDAHRQMGLEAPTTTNVETDQQYDEGAREGRLPCMIGHADARSLDVNLSDGKQLEFELVELKCDRAEAEKIIERYGDTHKGMFGSENANEEEIATSLFSTARKVFLKDGYHESIFFLFNKRAPVHIFPVRPEDQAQKYLLMRMLAHEVTKYGADAVIGLTEAWRAPADTLKPYQRAVDSPAREEILVASLVTKHEDPIQFAATIHRDGDSLTLGETQVLRNFSAFLFAPVYEAWGRSIPDQWIEMVEQHDKSSRLDEP